MADVLRHAGHKVQCSTCAAEALQLLKTAGFDCIITDLQMPGMTGIEFIDQLRQRQCPTQIVMVTAHATVATAVEAMRHGAFDYIEKPFEADALERLVVQAMRHGKLVHPEPDVLSAADLASPAMIGSSPLMQSLRREFCKSDRRRKPCLSWAKAAPAKSWSPARSMPPAIATRRRWSA